MSYVKRNCPGSQTRIIPNLGRWLLIVFTYPKQRYWQNRETVNIGLVSSVGRVQAHQSGGRRFKSRSSKFVFVYLKFVFTLIVFIPGMWIKWSVTAFVYTFWGKHYLVWTELVILWSCDLVILWSCDLVILWSCDLVILWSCDLVILWSCDLVILWSCDLLILWSCDLVILWSCDLVILWSCDLVILWSVVLSRDN